jgi:hypothetical protein
MADKQMSGKGTLRYTEYYRSTLTIKTRLNWQTEGPQAMTITTEYCH